MEAETEILPSIWGSDIIKESLMTRKANLLYRACSVLFKVSLTTSVIGRAAERARKGMSANTAEAFMLNVVDLVCLGRLVWFSGIEI